jgi:YecR-like lipoprotein
MGHIGSWRGRYALTCIVAAVTFVGVLGCAAKKDLVATGGSRADGTVDLSYELGLYEKPQIDQTQGLTIARQRCGAWGYADAEPFGGEKRQCQQFYGSNCIRWFVTLTYQCLGGGIRRS